MHVEANNFPMDFATKAKFECYCVCCRPADRIEIRYVLIKVYQKAIDEQLSAYIYMAYMYLCVCMAKWRICLTSVSF